MTRWPCCCLVSVAVSDLGPRERTFFSALMPEAETALALGHHVTTMAEWVWHATADGGQRCEADEHARLVCLEIKSELEDNGFPSEVVPYPGESGLQFRFIARSAGLGAVGKNAFLLHPAWGPWTHLRILATTAKVSLPRTRESDPVCGDCDRCVRACPAGAIREGFFEGLICRSYRKAKGEYEPVGSERILKYCKTCAVVCPVGEKPKPLSLKEKRTVEQGAALDVETAARLPRQ